MNRRERFGALLAHIVAEKIGTWRFVLYQAALMVLWIAWNVWSTSHRFDPYPFILGNLAMSAEAAFTGPILLIAANYQSKRDRDQLHRIENHLKELLKRDSAPHA